MSISFFEWLLARLPSQPGNAIEDLSFLTQEEIRELHRMRQEVRHAREQARIFVSQARSGHL